eukprot:2750056-Ditylum_brightwellii.AAC.1
METNQFLAANVVAHQQENAPRGYNLMMYQQPFQKMLIFFPLTLNQEDIMEETFNVVDTHKLEDTNVETYISKVVGIKAAITGKEVTINKVEAGIDSREIQTQKSTAGHMMDVSILAKHVATKQMVTKMRPPSGAEWEEICVTVIPEDGKQRIKGTT